MPAEYAFPFVSRQQSIVVQGLLPKHAKLMDKSTDVLTDQSMIKALQIRLYVDQISLKYYVYGGVTHAIFIRIQTSLAAGAGNGAHATVDACGGQCRANNHLYEL